MISIVAADKEGLKAQRLRNHHLRGSSAINYEADIILIINEKYHIVAKVNIEFNPYQAQRFRDWVDRDGREEPRRPGQRRPRVREALRVLVLRSRTAGRSRRSSSKSASTTTDRGSPDDRDGDRRPRSGARRRQAARPAAGWRPGRHSGGRPDDPPGTSRLFVAVPVADDVRRRRRRADGAGRRRPDRGAGARPAALGPRRGPAPDPALPRRHARRTPAGDRRRGRSRGPGSGAVPDRR